MKDFNFTNDVPMNIVVKDVPYQFLAFVEYDSSKNKYSSYSYVPIDFFEDKYHWKNNENKIVSKDSLIGKPISLIMYFKKE